MRKLILYIVALAILLANVNAKVDLIDPSQLPDKLHEGENINFSIKITDFEDTKQIIIETSLISTGGPLYDFGELNQYINENRYQQRMILNMSSLSQKILSITITGKTPEGVIPIQCNQNPDIIINKIVNTKLNFYEVRKDEKLDGIDSFELIVNNKETFENTMQQIRRKEFDNLKSDIRKLFDRGLMTEAQDVANDMTNIKWPDNLNLFGLIGIKDNLSLNIIVLIFIIIATFIGYIIRALLEED